MDCYCSYEAEPELKLVRIFEIDIQFQLLSDRCFSARM